VKHRSAWIAGIVGVAMAGLVLLFASAGGGDPAGGTSGGSGVVGSTAPDLAGTTTDGDPFDLESLRGQWVLVNFFATWCPPCVQEHPELVRFSERNAGRATVVSVAYDDTPDKIQQFFAANGGSWPVLAQDTGASIDFGVVKLPESFLIDPSGRIVRKLTGGVSAADVEALVDGRQPPPDAAAGGPS
jgi:cytochrome c biogenesis protein CcmG, thiol:disulfide interchange protein DsbE